MQQTTLNLDLHYELPPELIAQHPAQRRTESTLLVVDAGVPQPVTMGRFGETLLGQLRDDDLVVANDSRVLHARLRGTRPTGGAAELLLLEPVVHQDRGAGSTWRAMARPAKRLHEGDDIVIGHGLAVTCIEREPDGHWIVRLPVLEHETAGWLEQHGELPLPPYIEPDGQDAARYQTVYARGAGSVAAPTAGLHFDDDLWRVVGDRCETALVTLHVGAGTFAPVRDGDLTSHPMHAERYSVSTETDDAVSRALRSGRRVVAIGTTTTRVLESVYGPSRLPLAGSTRLLIAPGYEWGCVGALVTNFHLPESTLLALVMAFAGVDTTRAVYAEAIARKLRFYSFGDAMFVAGPPVRP